VFNVMLPRVYYPAWRGNLFERRCRAIANQLQGGDVDVDFDQVGTLLHGYGDGIAALCICKVLPCRTFQYV